MTILLDTQVAKILVGEEFLLEDGEYESPNFKLTRKSGIHYYSIRTGGIATPAVLAIHPDILYPYYVANTPKEITIAALKENYQDATKELTKLGLCVTKEIFEPRLSICQQCQHWICDENFQHGYCDADIKPIRYTHLLQERCPENKWV